MTAKPFSKKRLEMLLQQVPKMLGTVPEREQYMTPANIAADMVFLAYGAGSVAGRVVLDLGCGTGILAAGAAFLGAKEVLAVDIENRFLTQAREFALEQGLNIQYLCSDLGTLRLQDPGEGERFVTIQNPPFGAQHTSRRADRVFLEAAFACSDEVYSLHRAGSEKFLVTMARACGFGTELVAEYNFTIPHQFHFHRKEKVLVKVVYLRFFRFAPEVKG